MFSLRFYGSKFLVNLRGQIRVRKICSRRQLHTQVSGIGSLHLCLKLLFRKCVTFL